MIITYFNSLHRRRRALFGCTVSILAYPLDHRTPPPLGDLLKRLESRPRADG